MSKIYYNQADIRWNTHPYPSQELPKATIKSGGCGPTSAAMIVSNLKELILPNKMGDLFRQNGQRLNGGTANSAPEWVAKRYKLNYRKTSFILEGIECLKKGGMVMAYMVAGGTFSIGGHIICLAGMKDDNTIIVYDPYLYANKFSQYGRQNQILDINNNEVYITVDNFKKYNNYTLYCLENPNTQKVEKHKLGESVIISSHYNSPNDLVESAIYDNPYKRATIAYIQNGAKNPYLGDFGSFQSWFNDGDIRTEEIKIIPNTQSTVGQTKRFKIRTTIYSNYNLTGITSNYLANTSVRIIESMGNIDRIQVNQTGKIGFVKNNCYI